MERKEDKPRNYWLEGLLELGRNWALAVAIAGAGLTAFRTETVTGPAGWERYVFMTSLFISLIWMFLAVLRFDEGASQKIKGKGKTIRLFGIFLYLLLVSMGTILVALVGKFSDNNAIVKICDTVINKPESKIYQADQCVRLRKQRQALLDRLEGN